MDVALAKKDAVCVSGLNFFPWCASGDLKTKWSHDKNEQFQAYKIKYLTGEVVNTSEGRAAWHTAFREISPNDVVSASLAHVKTFSEQVRANKQITDIVNIGIGGSDLGPKLICEAFENQINGPSIHFISNLDSVQIKDVLEKLSANHTLFIVTSKSFSTKETIENMQVAMAWLMAHDIKPEEKIVAVTQNSKAAKDKYHINTANIFEMPEWIGGRYSLWSAVGLSCAIAFGYEKFYALHQGAYQMDQHFASAVADENMPAIYATQLYHAIQNKKVHTLGVLPYAHRLRSLPAYLQQLFMESLGKKVDCKGEYVNYPTGPIVFGGVGTNAQHSFQQLLMQGTHEFVVDYILPLSQSEMDKHSQAMMVANCMAQVTMLHQGSKHEDAIKTISGNKMANLFVLEKLDFSTLGALLAFYEHAVVTLGFLLEINPFDQWGVEKAKQTSSDYFNFYGEQLLSINSIRQILAVKD